MMTEDNIYQKLIKIFGSNYVSKDIHTLENYSQDLSFSEGYKPIYIVWGRKANQIEAFLKFANSNDLSVIPISSKSPIKYHGDTIPQKDNSIILELSKMNKILNIDKRNRVVMIEPGVTFGKLIPILKKKRLRILLPLNPRIDKSVLTTALERVPITIPRYHWDTSDPLLCTELVFGTGDRFRTGTAAGPGTIKQQRKKGAAQVNPMGPTQFSPYRIVQGAQGSIAVVTWATLKLELLPNLQKVFHLQSNNIQDLLDVQYELLKYRLGDEIFMLNNLNLASLVKKNTQAIVDLSSSLEKWNLIYVLSGRGKLAHDKISYQEADINDILKNMKKYHLKKNSPINENEILTALNQPTLHPWRSRLKGAFQDIFFVTDFENIPKFISIVEKMTQLDLGIYIQAINQGTSYHCEFDLFYDIKNGNLISDIKRNFIDISSKLINSGAFFNRPYILWAKETFANYSEENIIALKKVKKIFDPNNILNPGVLCFDD